MNTILRITRLCLWGFIILLAGCSPAGPAAPDNPAALPAPTDTPIPVPAATFTPSPTETPVPLPTPTFPVANLPLNMQPAIKAPQMAISPANAGQVTELGRWETSKGCDYINCAIAISPDGKLLAISSAAEGQPRGVYLYDLQNSRGLWYLPGESTRLLTFSPDGALLVDGSGQVWDTQTGMARMKFSGIGEGNEVWAASFSGDGSRLAVSTKQALQLWNLTDGAVKTVAKLNNVGIYALSMSPDGNLIAVSFNQGKLVTIDANSGSGEPVSTFNNGRWWSSSVAFSPDGQYVATGTTDGKVHLLKASSLEIVKTLDVTSQFWVTGLAFSPDGATLAAGEMSAMKLWNVADGSLLGTVDINGGFQDFFTFTSDSKSLFLHCAQLDTFYIQWFGIP